MTSRKTILAWTLGTGLAALTLTASAARQGQGTVSSPVSSPEPVTTTSCASAIDTQNRINRYFHQAVVPRMAGCWSRIAGAGTVAMHLEYQRTGEEWTPGPSVVRSSTLPRGEDDAALDCLRKAVEGTTFAVEPTDGESQQFNVNWSFPVPWPRDLSEAALRMASTGREPSAGECGGSEGPAPACFQCGFIPLLSLALCAPSCTGYTDCTLLTRTSCHHSGTRCVTGSVFGNIGGIVAYDDAATLQR
jgi:hypothetical protein